MSFYKVGRQSLVTIFFTLLVAACSNAAVGQSNNSARPGSALPGLTVYKGTTFGCCNQWIDHLNDQGINTAAQNYADLTTFKREKGIPASYHSCHTAVSVDGDVFEGHIPARFIRRFLAEKPQDTIGLSVPGMPVGSRGMVMGTRFMLYTVFLLKKDGSVESYAKVNIKKEQYE